MGLFDYKFKNNPVNRGVQELFTNKEMGTKKAFGLGNVQADVKVPIDIDTDARTTNTTKNTQITRSPTYNYSDARQISIIRGSPNSSLSSKKADKGTQEGAIPNVVSQPSQSGATVPIETPVSVGLGGGFDFTTLLLIGGVGVGAYYLFGK